uniref:UBC core domain-containing protein n=1 Tax=Erythrolobus madagascarensis TaxID=708628 RepID=A0A7S0XJ18_9RHOD
MASSAATSRLRKEYKMITTDPPPHITARPLPSNILMWYFVLRGPPQTAHTGGIYLGKLVFPTQYPYKPPSVHVLTPSGRFKPGAKLCLSMSDFHPETWNPLWSVGSVLTGLLSFMLGDEDTFGSMRSTRSEKLSLARASHKWNRKDRIFRELFPELVLQEHEEEEHMRREIAGSSAKSSTRQSPSTATKPERESAGGAANAGNDQQDGGILGLIGWLIALGVVLAAGWKLLHHIGSSV